MHRDHLFLRGAVKWLQSTSSFHETPPGCWSKVYQRGQINSLLARGSDIGQSQSNGNFPQDKTKPQAKVTTVHGHPNNYRPCLKKAKERSWLLGESQVESIIFQAKCPESWSLQEPRTRTGIAQHPTASAKAEIQRPILLSQLKGSPCCAQQEFHSWSQKLGHGFASQCICYFCRIVLQLAGSWCPVCDPLSLWGQVLTRSPAAGNAAPPKVVFWVFWLQGETFLQCGFSLCMSAQA